MFAALGNNAVWKKNDPATLIFAYLDAIAKEHGNFQDSVEGARADLSLSTINRVDNLQRQWGDMLLENLQGDVSVATNIQIWRNLLHRIIYGVDLLGSRYMPCTPVNIRQLILDYSLVPECKIFEFWKYSTTFAGASIVNNALVWNDATHSWNQGFNSTWMDIDTLKGLAYLVTGFQIFPEITGYVRDTALVERAAQMMKPYHNLIGFCWMLNMVDQAIGFSSNVAYIQLGIGNGIGPGCTTPVVTIPAVIDSLDSLKHVVTGSTNFKRALAIVRTIDLPPAAEITEACMLDGFNTPIAGTYQTFSAIHKIANKPMAMGYYYNEV